VNRTADVTRGALLALTCAAIAALVAYAVVNRESPDAQTSGDSHSYVATPVPVPAPSAWPYRQPLYGGNTWGGAHTKTDDAYSHHSHAVGD